MPSLLHEAPLLLFEQDPRLLLDLLASSLHLPLPAFAEVAIGSADHNEVLTLEGQSDKVLLLYPGDGGAKPADRQPVLGIIAESQLAPDEDKLYAWPFYHAALRRKLRIEVWLVVFCPLAPVARWARQPVPRYQPGSHFVPLVLGPEQVPRITCAEAAGRHPELAVLSALVHGNSPGGVEVVATALRAAEQIAGAPGRTYHDLILAILNEASAGLLKELLMNIDKDRERRLVELVADSYLGRQAVAEAEARAEARSILLFLSARDIQVSDEMRRRILGCQDVQLLERWIRRAATATTAAEVVAAD